MNRSRMWTGIILIVLGMVFLADAMDLATVGELMRTYWPVILIFFGIKAIFGRSAPAPTPPPPPPAPGMSAVSGDTLDRSTVFGNLEVRIDSRAFGGGSASTVFGNLEIDLTGATLREGQSLLKLSSVFGSMTVRLPRGMEFALSASTLMGSLTVADQRQEGFSPGLRYQSPGYASAPRTLMITASEVLGDIAVRTV